MFWKLTFADVKTADPMSKLHHIGSGLFASQRPSGSPGLLPEQIMELLTSTYGQAHAHLNWFTTLPERSVSIDLCEPPCLLALPECIDTPPELCGDVPVIVHDLIMCDTAGFKKYIDTRSVSSIASGKNIRPPTMASTWLKMSVPSR